MVLLISSKSAKRKGERIFVVHAVYTRAGVAAAVVVAEEDAAVAEDLALAVAVVPAMAVVRAAITVSCSLCSAFCCVPVQ